MLTEGPPDVFGVQERLVCTPLTKKTDHGEQNDPFCSPERVEDSYSEHKGPFRTSKGLHAFPYERALPLLVSFCPAWDRKTFVIPLFLSPLEQKDFRNQLINNSLITSFLHYGQTQTEKEQFWSELAEKGQGGPVQGAVAGEKEPGRRCPGSLGPRSLGPGGLGPGP